MDTRKQQNKERKNSHGFLGNTFTQPQWLIPEIIENILLAINVIAGFESFNKIRQVSLIETVFQIANWQSAILLKRQLEYGLCACMG